MLKALVVVLAVLCVGVYADSWKYAGVLKTAPQSTPPTFDSAGVCTAGTGASESVNFTITVNASTTYFIQAMFEKAIVSSATVRILSAAPGAPCASVLIGGTSAAGKAPHLHYTYTFAAAGTYYVVIQAASAITTDGIFAINIIEADGWADTTTSNMMWYLPNGGIGNSPPTCQSSTVATPYTVKTWTPATSGWYDAYTFYRNTTSGYTSGILAVYSSTDGVLPTNLTSTTAVFDPCGASNTSTHQFLGFQNSGAFSLAQTFSADALTIIPQMWYSNTTTYYFIYGGGYDQSVGPAALRVEPTRFGAVGNTTDFMRPSVGTSAAGGDTCTAASSGYVWATYTFTPAAGQYVFVVDTGYSAFDTTGSLYQGNNTNPPPTACPAATDPSTWVTTVDTGDISPMATYPLYPGYLYTAVVAPYSSGSSAAGAAFQLWAMSGNYLGPNVVSPFISAPVSPSAPMVAAPKSSASSLAISAVVALAALLAFLF
jgi:hypothetical protein